ncbi:SGNH/GDSL hydrolase family protein [Pontibacter populi]|uniref:SGNH/GDSL hydrolase family protein n=1 Tax=Pontibacter populi TaxID=890055 RepID=A0ABV1RX93_9BACT
MKNFVYKSGMLALFAGVLLTSCDPEIDVAEPTSGTADFSSYVAVGNSLTAGYADGGLYLEGQLSSYPALLAQQFQAVGGGDFTQSLFTEAQRNGTGYLRLVGFGAPAIPGGSPTPITEAVKTELAIRAAVGPNPKLPVFLYTKFTGNVNNLGVPDMRISEIKNNNLANPQNFDPQTGRALFFPQFERVAATAQQSYLEYVQANVDAAEPTFFSNWLGNNDVLTYATSGAFSSTLTDVATFQANYSELIDVLTANNAKGVVATIPNVTAVPFFTTVGPTLKAGLKAKGIPAIAILTGKTATRVPLPVDNIKDATGGTALIPLTASAYIPLLGAPGGKYWRDISKTAFPGNPTAGLQYFLGTYGIDTTQAFGTALNPWPSSLILDETEQAEIATRTTELNNIIKAEAQSNNLAIWDANAYFNSIQNGFTRSGVFYSPAYIRGNLFSLDGIHPTPRGQAIMANEFISAINAKYNARIPKVDETQYRAIVLP